jgi:hypothetical protein
MQLLWRLSRYYYADLCRGYGRYTCNYYGASVGITVPIFAEDIADTCSYNSYR